jgi:hypothetical protein
MDLVCIGNAGHPRLDASGPMHQCACEGKLCPGQARRAVFVESMQEAVMFGC